MQMKIAQWVCMLQIVGWKNCEHCTVVWCGKVWWGLWRAADRVRRPCVYRSFGRERLMLAPGCCVFGI